MALHSSGQAQLLISYVRLFLLVSSPSLASLVRWILYLSRMERSFGTHLARDTAALSSTAVILWQSFYVQRTGPVSTFRQFYFRPGSPTLLWSTYAQTAGLLLIINTEAYCYVVSNAFLLLLFFIMPQSRLTVITLSWQVSAGCSDYPRLLFFPA